MVSVDTTVLYTALPTLTSDLQADASQKLWIINAYPLVMAGLLLGAGTLGDRIGYKRMFLTGLALFAAASLLAAFAPSPPVLIAARAFLAVGAAAMLPATLSLIRITFDDEHQRGIAIGVWGTMAVLGAALGPIVGGLLLAHFWWGSVFLLNIPVVLLALVATVALVPGGSGHRQKPPIWDLIASLQALIALVGLVYAIQETAKPDPIPLAIVLALLAAAAGGSMFLRRQRRQTYPLIDFSLFRNRSLLTGVITAALAMAATAGIDLLLTQRLQLVLGLTPLHAGLIVTAFAAGSARRRAGRRPAPPHRGSLADRRRPVPGRPRRPGHPPADPGCGPPAGRRPGARHGSCRAWSWPGAGLGIVMVAASAAIISGAPPRRAGMASSIESVSYELGSLAGGAFGGKEDMSNQAQTALAAWLLGRPVKCTLSREESFRLHAKRHPIRLEYWAGCDAEGMLTAVRVRAVGDSGAYASVGMKVLERAAGHATGPYHVPAVDVESIAARTNNLVCGAFRGFGANQAQFAMDGVLDRLADAVGISGWEIRKRNVIRPGRAVGTGPGDGRRRRRRRGLPRRDQAGVRRGDRRRQGRRARPRAEELRPRQRVPRGVRRRRAVPREPDDAGRDVEVRHGWTEMGQGVHTVALQVAAEELGIDPHRIEVIVDTTRQLGFGQTTGSRGTLMAAGAVQQACAAARADGCQPDVDYHGEHVVDWTAKLGDPDHPNPTIHAAFGYAAQLVVIDRDTAKVERVVAVHDVGRAVNPQLCAGQIEGSVHMGLGYALSEDFPTDPESGFPTFSTLRQLGILRAKDVPEIEVQLVEVPQPRSPFGIKGVGEIGLVPTAPAVAAALHDLDGVWRASLPMRGVRRR